MKINSMNILVVDDEPGMCELIKGLLKEAGHKVTALTKSSEGLKAIREGGFEIILLDIRMPKPDGMELLKQAVKMEPQPTAAMITAFGSIEDAVECVKAGAFGYLTKPFQSAELKLLVDRIIEHRRLKEENAYLHLRLSGDEGESIIGKSKVLTETLAYARQAASGPYKILLLGESGTGKDLLAKFIHRWSPRSKSPFVPVQCGLLPENLLESELFGHVKGAFTGALSNRKGLIENADKGSIYLDEIGDISLNTQAKLLRFLQSSEFRAIGASNLKRADVRIISATNKDIEDLTKRGIFREDLYFRLKVTTIRLPSLRERKEDIPLLAAHFLKKASVELSRVFEISPDAMDLIMSHDWPGNIRELEHCLQSASSSSRSGKLKAVDLKLAIGYSNINTAESRSELKGFTDAKREVVDRFEKEYVERLLARHSGNSSAAARSAGLDKKNFWTLVKKHQVDPTRFK